MKKFCVLDEKSKKVIYDTDNYLLAEEVARTISRNFCNTIITSDKKTVALFCGIYEVTKAKGGYSIRKIGMYGRYEYLKSLYKGKAVFISDYAHEKKYSTMESAKRAINNIKE